MRGWRVLGAATMVVAAAVAVGGCSPANRAAVTLDEATRRPVLVIALCDDEGVVGATLSTVDDQGERGDVLWRIESPSPEPVDRVAAGEVPPGFREEDPLVEDLPGDQELYLSAGTKGGGTGGHGATFELDELSSEYLVKGGERMSFEDLRADGDRACRGGLFGLGVPWWAILAPLGGLAVGALGTIVGVRQYRRSRPPAMGGAGLAAQRLPPAGLVSPSPLPPTGTPPPAPPHTPPR